MNVSPASSAPYCLIVDDEPRLRQVMAHLMRGDGFQCVEAANGIEALMLLETTPAILVLSDLRMPKMDGMELLRAIRARFPDIAVVMITAVADVEMAVSCLALGAGDDNPLDLLGNEQPLRRDEFELERFSHVLSVNSEIANSE